MIALNEVIAYIKSKTNADTVERGLITEPELKRHENKSIRLNISSINKNIDTRNRNNFVVEYTIKAIYGAKCQRTNYFAKLDDGIQDILKIDDGEITMTADILSFDVDNIEVLAGNDESSGVIWLTFDILIKELLTKSC